jgi:RHS repeat-associated protein
VFNGSSYNTPPGTDFALSRNGSDYLLTNKTGITKKFNSSGLLQEIKDLSGNSTVFIRNDLGQVISMTDSGRFLSFSYNSDGTLTSTSNAAGQSIVYNYENGRLARVIDNDGYSYKYNYNLEGRLIEYIDKKDNTTKFEYSGSKVVKSIDALSNITTVNYLAGKTELVDPKGRKSTYVFDGANLLSMTTNAKNYSEKYIYDKRYNRIQMMPDFNINDVDFYVYKYTFDANDNLLSERDPLDAITTYTYLNNDPVKVVDPKGAITEKSYSTDGRRLLLSDKDAEGNITRYEYDLLGRKIAVISPKGEKTTTNYNEFGDVISVTSPKAETTSFEYDLVGRKVKDISPLGKESLYYYDSLSRPSKLLVPGDLVTRYEYDSNGNKVKEINPNDTYKTWEYDALNRVVIQRDEAGYETRYEYDAVGNKTKQIDAKGKVTAYDYDELNQLIKEYDATGIASTIGYNKNGDAVAVTDSKGQASSQILDKAGQVKSEIKAEGTTSYSYDATGNVTSLVSPKETLNVTYNKNGDVVTESSTQTGLVSRTYDSNQVQASVQTTVAKTDFVYDQNGEVSEVKATVQGTTSPALALMSTSPSVNIPTTPGSSTFKRDAEGKLSNIAKANGDIVSFTYDISGRVINMTIKNKDLVALADYTYQYDKVSNQTQIVDKNGKVFNYTYDARNQLLSDSIATYTYDAVGNRTEMATASGVVKYYYDNEKYGNRLTRVEYPNGRTVSYEYDNNGNATKKIDSIGGTTTYRYDSEDYFVEAVLADGTKVEYSYDEVSKRRTQRKVTKPSGQIDITKFTFDGDKVMSEKVSTGKNLRSYTWDENENLLSVAMPDASGTLKYYYFVKNAKGDIVGLTDSDGKLVAEYEYDSWGNILKAETLDASLGVNFAKTNPRLYASYWYDDVLGQYFMKARMYDAEIGRFYSQDPLESDENALSSNPYIYCDNNPINRLDPDGKFWHIVGGAAIGGLFGAGASLTSQLISGKGVNWKTVGKSGLSGAIGGGVFAATGGAGLIAAGALGGAAEGGSSYLLNNGKKSSVKGFAGSVAWGGHLVHLRALWAVKHSLLEE